MLETRSQEEVIAFFFSYWHTLFDLCFSFFLSFSKALCDHFRNWWTFFSYSLCAQPVVVEFWTRISDIESECSRAVCLICLDILFKRIKELYVRLTWRIKSFLYFMAWHIIGFKLLPLLISVDHFSIPVEALELLSVLTDHPCQHYENKAGRAVVFFFQSNSKSEPAISSMHWLEKIDVQGTDHYC